MYGYQGGKRGGGMDWESGIDINTLLCKIDNYTIVYSTVNSTQCSAVT